MKRLIIALVASVSAVSVLLTLGSAGFAADRRPKSPAQPAKPRPIKADRDHDKVFDDLEARLPGVQSGEAIDVIVTLDAPATWARIAELGRRLGSFRTARRFSVVDGFSARLTKAQVAELARVPWVEHVEANAVVRALNDSAASSFGVAKAQADLPGLDGDVDCSPAYGPGDLVAAVIDTGVDTGHLDLDEGKVVAFKDFVNGRADAYDDNGHGTHVASTIAGDGDARADRLHRGVAPGAGLVGLKVLDAAGSGTMDDVTAAIDWVVQNKDAYGIEAINLSLGAAGCSDGTDATSQAVERAVAAGIVVATAAGNEGPGVCTIGSPGAAASALTVGAMADLGASGFHQAVFSSRGPTADGRVKPDVSAPGVGVTSAAANSGNGYATFDGTSMATPFVAGLALLMREANPALTPAQVKDAVRSTAVDWGRAGADPDYGAGRLDGYAALKSAGAALTTGPAGPGTSCGKPRFRAPARASTTRCRSPTPATRSRPPCSFPRAATSTCTSTPRTGRSSTGRSGSSARRRPSSRRRSWARTASGSTRTRARGASRSTSPAASGIRRRRR
jgi:serine protease AprX